MTENQKLREALRELMSIVSIHQSATRNNFAWAEMAFAREALALPTADHIPDAGKMIETAAPVCERDAFEREMRCEEEWGHRSLKKRQNGQYENWQVDLMWSVWQARAAQSAGDAVDAQRYRWLADCLNYPEAVTLISDGSLTEDALGKAIDAAMRKDNT